MWTFSFTRWRELLVPSSRDDSPPCRNLFRSSLPAHSRVLLLLLTGAVEHISRRRQNNTVSNKSWGRRLSGHAVYIITTSIFLFTFFLFRFFLFFPFFCGLVLCQSLSLMATHQQLVKDLCYWKWGECFLCFLFSFFPAAIHECNNEVGEIFFRDCSSLNSQPFRLLHSHRSPSDSCNSFDVVGAIEMMKCSLYWLEGISEAIQLIGRTCIIYRQWRTRNVNRNTRPIFFFFFFHLFLMTQTKKTYRGREREREREYYRKKNEEKSDDERADIIYASVLSLGAENLLVVRCISSFLNSFRITKQLRRASPLISHHGIILFQSNKYSVCTHIYSCVCVYLLCVSPALSSSSTTEDWMLYNLPSVYTFRGRRSTVGRHFVFSLVFFPPFFISFPAWDSD